MGLEGALLLVRINFCKFFDPISFVYLCMKEKTLKKVTTIQGVNPSIHDVEKWSNILLKSCSLNNARFLKYVRPFLT